MLYIEDDPVNQLLMSEWASRWPGLQLHVAENGRTGIEAARTLRPDVVLLDLGLPDMAGEDVLAALCASGDPGAPSVMVLSATAMPDDVERALSTGAVDYITKPVDFAAFALRLGQLLDASPARRAS